MAPIYRAKCAQNTPFKPPCYSVGNLTVGGTGKTPMVVMMARTLLCRRVTGLAYSRAVTAGAEASIPWFLNPPLTSSSIPGGR